MRKIVILLAILFTGCGLVETRQHPGQLAATDVLIPRGSFVTCPRGHPVALTRVDFRSGDVIAARKFLFMPFQESRPGDETLCHLCNAPWFDGLSLHVQGVGWIPNR